MIDSWRLEKLMAYAVEPQGFPFVAGQMAYTIGPGGNWNTEWPARIEKVNLSYTLNDSPAMNLNINMLNLDQYQSLILPTTSSTIPTSVYIDDGYPLRTAKFYTVPSLIQSVILFCWTTIEEFATLDTVIALPPGYERALRFNLALEIAPEYTRQPSQIVLAAAATSKALIKSFNMRPVYMQVDNALLPHRTGFNYLTGE